MKHVLITTSSQTAQDVLASYSLNAIQVYANDTHIVWIWQSDTAEDEPVFDAVTEVLQANGVFRSSNLLSD